MSDSMRPADAAPGNWVDRHAPEAVRPYLRLARIDRPIGVWLLALPCGFGLALAIAEARRAGDLAPDAGMLIGYGLLFVIGATVMRGAGCAYNDIVDRDVDAGVARTAGRPLPSGQISVRGAAAFMVALALAGLAVLMQFNRFTISLGIASLGLVAAYPFMKRITWWPQVWLGLTFNWGVLMGYAAVAGGLSAAAFAAYAAAAFWTVGYDTIYACQDREDDALMGVKSSARALAGRARPAVGLFYAASLALFCAAGALNGSGGLYYFALAAPALHLWAQIRVFDESDPAGCLRIFRSNRVTGLMLLAALLLEATLRGA